MFNQVTLLTESSFRLLQSFDQYGVSLRRGQNLENVKNYVG